MESAHLDGTPDQVDYRNEPSHGSVDTTGHHIGGYDRPIDQDAHTVVPMNDQSWMFADDSDVNVVRNHGINSPQQQAELFAAPDFVADGHTPDLPAMVAWERYGTSTPPKAVKPW